MLNKLIVIGRQTAEPALKSFGDRDVASFFLAADTRSKDKEGKKITNYYRVSVWGKLAATVMQYLHKGDKVYVEGEMIPRLYQSNGETKVSLDVTASELRFLTEKSAGSASSAQDAPRHNNAAQDNDDLPF